MTIQTYNEFKVVFDDQGEIIEKHLTKRGTVRIDEQTAEINNSYTKSTGLLYEVKKEKKQEKAAEPAQEKK